MSISFSSIALANSPSRWENVQKAIESQSGEYLYFHSDNEICQPDRIQKLLSRVSHSADLIIPVPHTENPTDEGLEEPLLLPQRQLFERFRGVPLLNGKLIKKSFLQKCLESNVHDWIHSPCPDLFLLLFYPMRAACVRADYRFDKAALRWFVSGYRESAVWLEQRPDLQEEEKNRLQYRILQYADYTIDSALELKFSDKEMTCCFDSPDLVYNYYTNHRDHLLRMRQAKPEFKPGPVRNLALFTWALRIGGAERCASILLHFFSAFPNLKIFLFQSREPEPGDYPCPGNVEIVVLPRQPYLRRVHLRKNLLKKKIDTCIFFDHINENYYFDILTARSLGIHTVAMLHNTFSSLFYSGVPELLALRKAVLPSADIVTCLSRADEYFWNQLGIHALYMPNPLTFDTSARPAFSERKTKTLIFIARMTPQKGTMDALRTVEIVRKRHPDVRLLMLGSFPDPAFEKQAMTFVKEHDLAENVEFTGFAEVEDYITSASVHLMPSKVEGWSLVLLEAKYYGLPTVAYEMPYLETLKDEFGSVMVPQMNYQAMAEKVSELFDDFERLNDLGRKAYASLSHFDNQTVITRWKQLFQYLETGRMPEELAVPSFPVEKQLEFQRIQTQELVAAISVMQTSRTFRKKILDEGIADNRHKNVLFDHMMRVYFIFRGKIEKRLLKIIFGFSFTCLWQIKRLYRRFKPWTDEEQKL